MKFSISLALSFLACVLFLTLSCEAGKAQNSARPDWRESFVPIDPWRTIGTQTNYVKSAGVQFCGKIVDVMPHGVRIEGQWGQLGSLYYPVNGWTWLSPRDQPGYAEFFVTNYPYKAISGGIIASATRLMAWYAGTYTYTTANGVVRTIPKLDYGIPSGPNPLYVAAVQKQIREAQEKRRTADSRRMEFLERDATNGDISAQYSLGFHYLHGIDCETNQVMGIYWLLQAAQHGNVSASNDLQQLENAPISTNRPGTLRR
jgi:Sel1 repeat